MTATASITTASPRTASLSRIAFGVAPFSVVVQIASFISSIALARVFGASAATDAYFLGLSIPVLAYAVLLAAVRLGAIPLLTDVDVDDPRAFSRVASDLVSIVAATSVGLTLVAAGVAAGILPVIIGDPRVAAMTRWTSLELAPLGFLGALAGALGAILAVRGRFAAPVAVMTIEPLLKTLLTLTLGHTIGINALIIGNLVGSATAASVLIVLVRSAGIDLRVGMRPDPTFLRALFAIGAPLLVAQSVLQINPVIDRTMASALGSGKVTSLELGLRLFVVPTTLLTATLIGPIAATWAARYAAEGLTALRQSASRAVGAAVVGVPPVLVLGLLLRHDVISFVYRGGAYSPHAVRETAGVFGMLVIGLPAQVLVLVYATIFVVQKDTLFPMKIACGNVLLNVGLNFALRPWLGVAGIALSTSLTFTVLVAVYAVVARRRWGPMLSAETRAAIARAAGATAAMAVVAGLLLRILPSATSRPGMLFLVAIVTAASASAYVLGFVAWRLSRIGRRRAIGAGA